MSDGAVAVELNTDRRTMRGRYHRKSDKQKIAESFHVKRVDDFPLPPSDYNVVPSTNQPDYSLFRCVGVTQDEGRNSLLHFRARSQLKITLFPCELFLVPSPSRSRLRRLNLSQALLLW